MAARSSTGSRFGVGQTWPYLGVIFGDDHPDGSLVRTRLEFGNTSSWASIQVVMSVFVVYEVTASQVGHCGAWKEMEIFSRMIYSATNQQPIQIRLVSSSGYDYPSFSSLVNDHRLTLPFTWPAHSLCL